MCGCCGDCDACTVVCVACVFAARLLVCEGDGSAGVGFGGGVFAVSAYMGGTRGSGVLVSAGDVLEISVVRGVGAEWVTGLGLGITNSGGTWVKWDMCLGFGCGGVGGIGREWMGGLGQGLGGWCGVMSVYCARRILAHLRAPSLQSCCTLSISDS